MLHIEDGFAVIIEEEEENTTAPSFYDFSHLTEEEPLPFEPIEPKTDKKNNLLLF